MCRGFPEGGLPFLPPGSFRPPIDIGPFHLALALENDARDSAYVFSVAKILIPSLLEIVGPPNDLDTLYLVVGARGPAVDGNAPFMTMPAIKFALGIDDDGDGRIDEDPYDGFDNDGDGKVDEDLTYHRDWDSIFIHELAHAFQIGLDLPSWIAEGTAEAAQYMVAEHAAGRVSRGFDHPPTLAIAADDILNRESSQIIGGRLSLNTRFDVGWAYRAASVSIILPCLAEIAAGRSVPHPLSRLKRSSGKTGERRGGALAVRRHG